MATYTIEHYLFPDGTDIFGEWFNRLRDHNAKARISMRLDRVEDGNFGSHKYLDHGVWELKIDYGPGYRVYYSINGPTIILLFCGGDKRTQDSDIKKAIAYKVDYERSKS